MGGDTREPHSRWHCKSHYQAIRGSCSSHLAAIPAGGSSSLAYLLRISGLLLTVCLRSLPRFLSRFSSLSAPSPAHSCLCRTHSGFSSPPSPQRLLAVPQRLLMAQHTHEGVSEKKSFLSVTGIRFVSKQQFSPSTPPPHFYPSNNPQTPGNRYYQLYSESGAEGLCSCPQSVSQPSPAPPAFFSSSGSLKSTRYLGFLKTNYLQIRRVHGAR